MLTKRERHVLEYRIISEQRAKLEQHPHPPAGALQFPAAAVRGCAGQPHLMVPAVGFTCPPMSRRMASLARAAQSHDGHDLPRGIAMSMPVSTRTHRTKLDCAKLYEIVCAHRRTWPGSGGSCTSVSNDGCEVAALACILLGFAALVSECLHALRKRRQVLLAARAYRLTRKQGTVPNVL